MKKYIISIVLVGIIFIGVLLYNVIIEEQRNNRTFADSGYVLQVSELEEENVQRYYFNAEETYKTRYEQKVIFDNTEGEQVSTGTYNFIHYSNNSVSSFTNGVLLELNNIDDDPIQYYNILASDILEKDGEYYTVDNLGQKLNFKDVIWKISSTKYIILSDNIKLVFDDSEPQEISGYVEIEYLDNQIVKIYNQEVTYQTISSNAYIELPNNIRIMLGTKAVSKNNDIKMNLENMVIDSDDNVTIANVDEDNSNEENENNVEQQNTNTVQENETNTNTNTSQSNSTDTTQNVNQTIINNNESIINNYNNMNQTIINNGGNTTGEGNNNNTDNGNTDNDNDNDNNDDDIDFIEVPKAPEFNVEEFNVNSIGFDSLITIKDEEELLTGDFNISILENSSGKKVYQSVENLGVDEIDLSVSTLKPNTDYTLVVESTYAVDGITYTKNFVYKIFRTLSIGISVEKDVFTSESLGFALTVDKDTKVKSVDVVLSNSAGETIQTKTVNIEVSETEEIIRELVDFSGLSSNTEYTVSLTNVLYEGQILTNGYIESLTYKTLKTKPILSGTSYEVNKRDGAFSLRLENIQDPDNGIQKYRFEIYVASTVGEAEPIKTVETDKAEITVNIDDENILRNVEYVFKVVAEFQDNEKIYEYESEYSEVFSMDGVAFPTVRFEESTVTFERITGTIRIEDNENAIDETETQITVTYTDSIGNLKSFTSTGSYDIPVDVNNLRANETYRFGVYATIDLKDGNDPIEQCYIGGFIVQTEKPQNMVASFVENQDDVQNLFSVNLQLKEENDGQGTLEPETLTGVTISLYAGQTEEGEFPTGSLLRTVELEDSNIEPYESELKEQLYDNSIKITPAFFNADNDDFKDTYYTITITNGYDYTDYENELPILNNVYTIETNGYMPDLPVDVNNAVTVTPIRNYSQTNPREDLDDNTIVGYTGKAVYDNSGLYAKKVIYSVYNAETNELVDTIELEVGEDGVIPSFEFDVLDGTPLSENDEGEIRRGNSYYFTYEMELDLNSDGYAETHYPYEEEIVLKSATQSPSKQEPYLIMYPTTSSNNTLTFKYKFTDVDNTVGNNNQIIAKVDNATLSQQNMEITDLDFKEITFSDLRRGTLTLTLSKCLMKSEGLEDYIFSTQYFEAENTVSGMTYEISYDINKLSIKFNDGVNALDYVTAIRIELVSKEDPSQKIVRDFETIPSNKTFTINYNDLGELLKQETEVNVYAYYDSGVQGYETDSEKYVTYQMAYERDGQQVYYYDINTSSNLVQDTSPMGNIYTASREDNVLTLKNVITGRSTKVTLSYSDEGFLYNGNVIVQKQIEEQQLVCVGDNVIYFDFIVPGISLLNDANEQQITTEIDNVSVTAELQVNPSVEIENGLIYIDVYQTDSEHSTEKLVKTVEVDQEAFSSAIQITDLIPKTYYFIKFRTIIRNDENELEAVYLFDLDDQVSGKSYYFSTLADVVVNNIAISYNAESYEEKYIDISYTLGRIAGYDRIEYELYHYNTEIGAYEQVFEEITPDETFKNNMTKSISINPGSGFIFGDQYKLRIIPIAEYNDPESGIVELELGTKEKEFTFNQLSDPTIAVSGSRREDNSIAFRITVYDDNKVIVGDGYTIRIYDGQLQEITPDEYKDVVFSTSTINNTVIINNVENTQSYTILVTAQTDKENTNIEEEYRTVSRQYTIPEINEYGISIGDVTINRNSQNAAKMDLLFNNSYKLEEIDQIRYSIYNTNGYSQNGTASFVPTQITSGSDTYYRYTINETLSGYGTYFVELQFLKNNEVIETISIEYVYLQS